MSDEKMDAVSAWGEIAQRLEEENAALREEVETGKKLAASLLANFFKDWPAGVRETWEAAMENQSLVCVLKRLEKWAGETQAETAAPCVGYFREVKSHREEVARLCGAVAMAQRFIDKPADSPLWKQQRHRTLEALARALSESKESGR